MVETEEVTEMCHFTKQGATARTASAGHGRPARHKGEMMRRQEREENDAFSPGDGVIIFGIIVLIVCLASFLVEWRGLLNFFFPIVR